MSELGRQIAVIKAHFLLDGEHTVSLPLGEYIESEEELVKFVDNALANGNVSIYLSRDDGGLPGFYLVLHSLKGIVFTQEEPDG